VEKGGGRLLPGAAVTFLICEDGNEYTERFQRFLGAQFRFVRAQSFLEALQHAPQCRGLLLDLDFRRIDPSLLVDETGAPAPRSAAEVQGILILRALRSRGIATPALLFADLDDAGRVQRLEAELAPLSVVASGEGLAAIAQRLQLIAR
jgi:hypothetical protein